MLCRKKVFSHVYYIRYKYIHGENMHVYDCKIKFILLFYEILQWAIWARNMSQSGKYAYTWKCKLMQL